MKHMCRSSSVMACSTLSCSVALVLGFWWCVQGTCLDDDVCNRTETRPMCGPVTFDINRYTCCAGNITMGPHLACCGLTAFNNKEKTCCNNIITDGLSQMGSDCCGSEAYNFVNQICCGGQIKNRITAETLCCGSELYEPKDQLCCGKDRKLVNKTSEHDRCCGTNKFNNQKQCCSDNLEVEALSSRHCESNLKTEENTTAQHKMSQSTSSMLLTAAPLKKQEEKKATNQDSASPDKCKRNPKHHSDHVTQCCGSEVQDLSNAAELCCEGRLYRNQLEASSCVGKIAFSPKKDTVCQQEVHQPAGQQCCGEKTLDPKTEICCNGHRHKTAGHEDMVCCGSCAYSASSGTHKCCSGHLHDLTGLNKEEVGCCGTLLLTNKKKQHCCHSVDETLIYDAKPGHSCCGHLYYSHSLWSCCAGRLIPEPTNPLKGEAQAVSHELWLMDFTKDTVCNKSVLLGTVESVAIKQSERFVLLQDVLNVSFSTSGINVFAKAPETVQMNHCKFPALKTGKTYLWKKKDDGEQCEPMADVSSLTSPIHTILSLCQSAGSHNAT
ncbi:galaxin isoform X2 [Astyanax mexicanus]|uniref:galaxin isoform X2 n=1 Tax=Astyanax mexicanus TaxID=7994 RepID=UPI0020CB5EEB|nr:galaxin isoform X2 [Astyanax mexicanus]